MTHIEPNEAKFRELILYIANRAKGDPSFGAIKLNKILYYSEFTAYRELGHPISGVPFQNLEHGPAPRRLLPVQQDLLDSGDARLAYEPTPAGLLKRLIPLRDPDVSMFKQDELDIIDRVTRKLRSQTATQISLDSHDEPGWIVTSEEETIPYHMALLSRPDPGAEDIEYVAKLVESGAVQSR